jgi:signal transduction histidine kinase/ligand-binding sensor domain-containing protein
LALALACLWCSGVWNRRAACEEFASAYYARTWTTDDGLPHNDVTHIIQDRAGYIWLATLGGLSRFDGREFKTLEMPLELQQKGYNIRGLAEETDSTLLLLLPSHDVVQSRNGVLSIHPITNSVKEKSPVDVFCDLDGAVWVATEGGNLFRWQRGRTSVFGKADGIDRRNPNFSFANDRHGRTWIGTGSFLGYYSDGALVPFGKPLGNIILIAAAHTGGIWVLADSRLLRLDDGVVTVEFSEPGQLPATALLRQVFEDRNHSVWIATGRRGLFRYAQGKLERIAALDDFTRTVAEDREGDIWVGTEGSGVSMLRESCFSLHDSRTGMPQATSTAVCVDSAGDVWFANQEGGLVRDRKGHILTVPGTEKLNVNTVCPDREGGLWFGGSKGLYHLAPDQALSPRQFSLPPMDFRTLFCARSGDLWFATALGELGFVHGDQCRLFSSQEGYPNKRGGTAIAEDRTGTIWIGPESGGLWQCSGGQLSRVLLPASIPIAPIHNLFVDSAGLLWIGTANGLVLRQGGEFKRFTEAEGLFDRIVFQIQEDNLGFLWIGSRHGLYRVARESLLSLAGGTADRVNSVSIGKEVGLPATSMIVNGQPLCWKDSTGNLWFTTIHGVLEVNPTKIAIPAAHSPVLVEQVLLDGQPQDMTPPFRVAGGRHRLEFHFAVLSYAVAGRILLRHQLDGIDPGWVETGADRIASYSSLPPGRYRLRVMTEGGSGGLDFMVVPLWWQTIWARVGATLVVIGGMAMAFGRYSRWHVRRELERLKQEHAVEDERARIARDLHDELGGSLTRIAFGADQLKRRLVGSDFDPLVEQLNDRIRRHASDLQRVIWVESAKNDSLDRLASLIARFGRDYFRDSRVECVVRIADPIPSVRIQPEVQYNLIAIAKEAFNNVLKHAHATEVVIAAQFRQSAFVLTIKDNGVGFVPGAGDDFNHNGLSNMRTRIAEIGGKLEIHSQPGAGTEVSVVWPLDSQPRGKRNPEDLKFSRDPN